jgi:hypothetical protein
VFLKIAADDSLRTHVRAPYTLKEAAMVGHRPACQDLHQYSMERGDLYGIALTDDNRRFQRDAE